MINYVDLNKPIRFYWYDGKYWCCSMKYVRLLMCHITNFN